MYSWCGYLTNYILSSLVLFYVLTGLKGRRSLISFS